MDYFDYMADPKRQCAIVAHRGVWRRAPENSLAAIEQAIAEGYSVVEIDVRRTADGRFALMHDDTLERMADISAKPEDLDLKQLTELTLRDRDGGPDNAMTMHRLPSLEEVFELTRDRIFIHLDIKHRDVIPEVLSRAKAMGVDRQVDFWADLKTGSDLRWVRQNITDKGVPFIARTHLEDADFEEQLDLVFQLNPFVCEVSFRELSQVEMLQDRFHKAGIVLWVNTLDGVASAGFTDSAALKNPAAVWGLLLDAGVSSIQTDEMAALKTYLDTRENTR